ncbi:MAG: membrane dipeptidase [Alphaproteobacteria bacterium]
MKNIRIDGLQYCRWSEKIFKEMRQADISAVHVTIAYHENFRETILNIEEWNGYFEQYSDLIIHGKTADDILYAKENQKTAIIFGAQNASPIEDDIGLVKVLGDLGLKFMQLTYNNQSLLATGCYERCDNGITRMGRQVIKEMNNVGMIIDMSHSAKLSTLQAIELSEKPIVISHGNPSYWHKALRNKDDDVIKSLVESGGIIGFSLYSHHLKGGSECSLEEFCSMVAQMAEKYGVASLAIGSDLCQGQPDHIVQWMRMGRWSRDIDYGEGSPENIGFPKPVPWFKDNLGFKNIEQGLRQQGFAKEEVADIIGGNWLRFFREQF